MRLIDTDKEPLAFPPHKCAVTGRCFGEVFDFGVVQPGHDPRLYLLRSVLEDAARKVGMVPEAEVTKLQGELDSMGQQIDELKELIGAYQTLGEKVTA